MLVKDNVNGDIDINGPLDLIWGVDANFSGTELKPPADLSPAGIGKASCPEAFRKMVCLAYRPAQVLC